MPTMMVPVSLRKPELMRFSPTKPEWCGDHDLFHLQFQMLAAGGYFDEIDDIGTEYRLRHSAAADHVR